jgi:hypothetical protein
MVWIWQRDPTVCPTCEHPSRLHNTNGCIMPGCGCEWVGRSRQLWAQLLLFAVLFAIVVWMVSR